MAKIRLRYVNEYIDVRGKLRRYFRKGGKQEASTPRAEEDLGDTLQRSIEEAKARKPQPAQAGTIKEPANLNIRRRKGTK